MTVAMHCQSRALARMIVVLLLLLICAPRAQAQSFSSDLRWAGLLHDAFIHNTGAGLEVWSAEDGGRIRHRDTAGMWSFQVTPDDVKDTIRKVFFLSDGLTGWAVGNDGRVLATTNGGAPGAAGWHEVHRQVSGSPTSQYEDLWDVRFLSANEGWILGLHGIWYTTTGAAGPWTDVSFLDQQGALLDPNTIELYALDIIPGQLHIGVPDWTAQPTGYMLGLASAEPGLVLRADDPLNWHVTFDIRSNCGLMTGCALNACNASSVSFEAWDVAISRHLTQPLALVVGGYDNGCGDIFSSTDNGVT